MFKQMIFKYSSSFRYKDTYQTDRFQQAGRKNIIPVTVSKDVHRKLFLYKCDALPLFCQKIISVLIIYIILIQAQAWLCGSSLHTKDMVLGTVPMSGTLVQVSPAVITGPPKPCGFGRR